MQEITLVISIAILSLSIILAIFAFIEMFRKEWLEFFWLSSKAIMFLGLYQFDLNNKVALLCFFTSFVLCICQDAVRTRAIENAIERVKDW